MRGQRPPKIGKLLHKFIVLRQPRLEIALRMQVDYDRQPVIEDHLQCRIERPQILRRDFIRLAQIKHWLRLHAQTHVIEAPHRYDRDVLDGRPSLKMLRRVAALVIHLREPLTGVDPPPQSLRPPEHLRWRVYRTTSTGVTRLRPRTADHETQRQQECNPQCHSTHLYPTHRRQS